MRVTILCADSRAYKGLEKELKGASFEVSVLSQAKSAWKKFKSKPSEILIFDTKMEGIDPQRFITQVRELDDVESTYIIAISGEGDDAIGKRQDLAADDFIVKPITDQALVARIEIGERIVNLQSLLRESQSRLASESIHDERSKVLNRIAIQEFLKAEINRSQRLSRPVSLILIDVDNLLNINEKYGIELGDKVLFQVAQTVQANVRAYDMVGRWQKDEFLLILPDVSVREAKIVAERIRNSVSTVSIALPEDAKLWVTACFAVTSKISDEPVTMDDLLEQLYETLEKAKAKGQSQIEYHWYV